jgi:hypothetical protein
LHLNTVAVGLEAIASDPVAAQKAAATLNVGWRPPVHSSKAPKNLVFIEPLAKHVSLPTTPAGLRDLTSRSKIFVLRAVLVAACDSLDMYVTEVARTGWLKIDDAKTIDICTKADTKPNNVAWSLAERYATLCQALDLSHLEGHCAIVALGSRWRNALVHAEDAKFVLANSDRQMLISNAAQLNKAGFVVGQALARFTNKLNPTLKDVTTIIAYAQELCTEIDRRAIKRIASKESDVEQLLRERLRAHFKSRGRVDDFWGIHRDQEWDKDQNAKVRGPDRTARAGSFDVKWVSRFGSLLDALGFSATKHPASAPVSDREIGRLSSMSANQFADELELPER